MCITCYQILATGLVYVIVKTKMKLHFIQNEVGLISPEILLADERTMAMIVLILIVTRKIVCLESFFHQT